MSKIKPVIQYPGSKVRMAPRIIELLGPHQAYLEPYAGSAAVLLAKPRTAVETINDRNDLLVSFFETLRNKATRFELIDALVHTPYAERELQGAVDDPALDPVERARRFFIRTNMAYVGSNGKGSWTMTVQASSGHTNATKWMNYITRLSEVSSRLQGVQISCRDALVEVARVGAADSTTAIYCDPPYLHTTRNGARYEVDDGDEAHHTALIGILKTLQCPVVLSAYDNALYDDLLLTDPLWSKLEYNVAASSNSGKGSTAKRTEIIWANSACQLPEVPTPSEA